MKTPPTSMPLSAAPRQLSMPFDSARLRGMSPGGAPDRRSPGWPACCCRPPASPSEERDDDER